MSFFGLCTCLGKFTPLLPGVWLCNKSFHLLRVACILGAQATTYELITICTSEAGGMSPDLYMVITSYSNSVIYFLIFSLIPRFRTEFRRLIDAGVWYIFLAVISELCNWVAAWAITYAYRAHYNSGIVNAVEVSLNQIANLVVAILLKKFFDFGRDEAVTHVGTKVCMLPRARASTLFTCSLLVVCAGVVCAGVVWCLTLSFVPCAVRLCRLLRVASLQ